MHARQHIQHTPEPVAIIGAGPAGASLAYWLASAGREVLLFDGSGGSEKHCGGGVPARTLDQFPWLRDIASPSTQANSILFTADRGQSAEVALSRPITLYARSGFDAALRNLARGSGATLIAGRVRAIGRDGPCWTVRTDAGEFSAGFIAGADGASSLVRRTLAQPFSRRALSLCAGYYIPASDPRRISVAFLKRRAAYAWFFPCPGLASAGVVAPLIGARREELLHEVRAWLAGLYPGQVFDFSRPYAAIVPTYHRGNAPYRGEGWALVGDAAGVADPVTREGIYFSIQSSALLAAAILDGNNAAYGPMLSRFLKSSFGGAVIPNICLFRPFFTYRFTQLLARQQDARMVIDRFISGALDYRNIKRTLATLNLK
ncbi:MAG: NAD(P)/FAD-dependent oxidoreductase [Candidatus Aureabacteria bacterium]|nr:NAD(P)/FAD-dependent oxidoreductase [Candidatus Auribacterota bacterium]